MIKIVMMIIVMIHIVDNDNDDKDKDIKLLLEVFVNIFLVDFTKEDLYKLVLSEVLVLREKNIK